MQRGWPGDDPNPLVQRRLGPLHRVNWYFSQCKSANPHWLVFAKGTVLFLMKVILYETRALKQLRRLMDLNPSSDGSCLVLPYRTGRFICKASITFTHHLTVWMICILYFASWGFLSAWTKNGGSSMLTLLVIIRHSRWVFLTNLLLCHWHFIVQRLLETLLLRRPKDFKINGQPIVNLPQLRIKEKKLVRTAAIVSILYLSPFFVYALSGAICRPQNSLWIFI